SRPQPAKHPSARRKPRTAGLYERSESTGKRIFWEVSGACRKFRPQVEFRSIASRPLALRSRPSPFHGFSALIYSSPMKSKLVLLVLAAASACAQNTPPVFTHNGDTGVSRAIWH